MEGNYENHIKSHHHVNRLDQPHAVLLNVFWVPTAQNVRLLFGSSEKTLQV